ncbi:MAG: hypothetical protein AAFO07_29810 [Bacteroidota bacterium]
MKKILTILAVLSCLTFANTAHADNSPEPTISLDEDFQNGFTIRDSLLYLKWGGELTTRTPLKITSKIQNFSKVRPAVQIKQDKSFLIFTATWPRQYNGTIITIDKNTFVGNKNGKKLYLKRGKYTVKNGKLNVPLTTR